MTVTETIAELDRLRAATDALLKQLVAGCPIGKVIVPEVKVLAAAATLLDGAATGAQQVGIYAEPDEPWDWQNDFEKLRQPLVAA